MISWLVVSTLLKNMKVSWHDSGCHILPFLFIVKTYSKHTSIDELVARLEAVGFGAFSYLPAAKQKGTEGRTSHRIAPKKCLTPLLKLY
jgi:hypothetical protein